jgi:membrane-associated phospholipid phosphatase
MFQTSLNHFLQGFAGSFSNWFMNFMSDFGSYPVYLAMIFIVMFGWNLSRGFFIMHIMIWVGISNSFLKDYFNLPRPTDIDETLKVPGPDYNHINIDGTNHSASGFFQTLPQEIIDKCRALGLKSAGFPSGHSASAAAFWTTLPLLVKKTWLWILALLIMCLIMISRMYLGLHFLADIAGGFLSGILIVTIGFIIFHSLLEEGAKGQNRFPLYTFTGRMFRYLYYLGVPIALSFIPHIGIQYTAPLMGINLVIISAGLRNIDERGQVWERFLRILIVIGLYLAIAKLITLLPTPKTELLKFVEISLQYFLTVRLAISLCVWAKLYRRTY